MTVATMQFTSETLWREVTYAALLPDAGVVSQRCHNDLVESGSLSKYSFTLEKR